MSTQQHDESLIPADWPEPSSIISAQSVFHMPRYLPPLKAVLFDWDQTMADSNMLYRRTQQETLKELFGDPFFFGTDTSRFRGQSIQETFIKYYRDQLADTDWEAKSRHAYARFIAHGSQLFHELLASKEIRLFDGAKHTLEGLIAKGIPVAIVSNAPQEFIEDLMLPELLGNDVAGKLTAVGMNFDRKGKPDTDTCEMALEKLEQKGLLPRDTDRASIYFVGDSAAHDIEVAHAMGFTPVLYGVPAMDAARQKHYDAPDAISPAMHRFLHADCQHELQRIFAASESHTTPARTACAAR